MDSSGSERDTMVGCCKHGKELSWPIIKYQPLKNFVVVLETTTPTEVSSRYWWLLFWRAQLVFRTWWRQGRGSNNLIFCNVACRRLCVTGGGLTYWPGVELGVSRQENELVSIPSRENFILLVLAEALSLLFSFLSAHFATICPCFFFHFYFISGILTVIFSSMSTFQAIVFCTSKQRIWVFFYNPLCYS